MTLSSTAPDPTKLATIPVSVTFSAAVTGFTAADLVVGNASVSGFTGSGTSYAFVLTATADGAVTVAIPAGAAQNGTGSGNEASETLSRTVDRVAPTITLTTPAHGSTIGDTTPNFSGIAGTRRRRRRDRHRPGLRRLGRGRNRPPDSNGDRHWQRRVLRRRDGPAARNVHGAVITTGCREQYRAQPSDHLHHHRPDPAWVERFAGGCFVDGGAVDRFAGWEASVDDAGRREPGRVQRRECRLGVGDEPIGCARE